MGNFESGMDRLRNAINSANIRQGFHKVRQHPMGPVGLAVLGGAMVGLGTSGLTAEDTPSRTLAASAVEVDFGNVLTDELEGAYDLDAPPTEIEISTSRQGGMPRPQTDPAQEATESVEALIAQHEADQTEVLTRGQKLEALQNEIMLMKATGEGNWTAVQAQIDALVGGYEYVAEPVAVTVIEAEPAAYADDQPVFIDAAPAFDPTDGTTAADDQPRG